MIPSSRPFSFSTRSAVTCIAVLWPASSQRTAAPRSSAASIMRSRSFGTASELTAPVYGAAGIRGICDLRLVKSSCLQTRMPVLADDNLIMDGDAHRGQYRFQAGHVWPHGVL